MRRPYTTYFPNQLADKLRKHRVIGHYALLFGADCCLFACGPTGVAGGGDFALHEAVRGRVVGVSDPHVVQIPPFGDGEAPT